MFTVYGLQKITDVLIENPSWSIAHLVANFNLIELISNPKVQDLIDYPDHTTLMTPFQVGSMALMGIDLLAFRRGN